MKRVLFIVTIVLGSITSKAQKTEIGIIAGANFNSLKLQTEDVTVFGQSTGFHAGAISRLQFNPKFAIQPQLQISSRGGNWATTNKIKTNILTLELPVSFLYTEKNFFAGGGPSFRYGLSSSFRSADIDIDAYDKDKADTYLLTRFEFGANLVAGYKLDNGLLFSGSYNPGFSNLNKTIDIRSGGFALSVGYLFH